MVVAKGRELTVLGGSLVRLSFWVC
eukprot:COSAG06_NODE_54867_length_292_cov_1.062176_1_plen_24_part_01